VEVEFPLDDHVAVALVHGAPDGEGGDGIPAAVFAAEEGGGGVVEAPGVRVREQVQPMGAWLVQEVVPVPYIGGDLGVDGDAEEDEVGVRGDNPGLRFEDQVGAVDAQVGEERRAGGMESHLDGQAAARGAPGGGGVGEVCDVAPHVDEDGGVVTVALGKGRRNARGDRGDGGHGDWGRGRGKVDRFKCRGRD